MVKLQLEEEFRAAAAAATQTASRLREAAKQEAVDQDPDEDVLRTAKELGIDLEQPKEEGHSGEHQAEA